MPVIMQVKNAFMFLAWVSLLVDCYYYRIDISDVTCLLLLLIRKNLELYPYLVSFTFGSKRSIYTRFSCHRSFSFILAISCVALGFWNLHKPHSVSVYASFFVLYKL